jgi:serine/threonine protein kinase
VEVNYDLPRIISVGLLQSANIGRVKRQNVHTWKENEQSDMEAKTSTQIGKYRLIRHLAHGGMSDVYLAKSENDEQLYALKLVSPETAENYWHFRREMSILSTLKHEHILHVFDYYTEENGIAYYVTPYIEQGSLKERIATGPLSLEEASTILSQVGEALQFIHELGLVHRDIKPANILLDETNYVWLADFGLAKEVDAPSDLTSTGCLLGTPFYIAPELVEEPASVSSDIYALGVVLYEMLTGTPPFTGQSPLMICWKHVYEPPPLPSTLNPLISVAVEQVILRALAKNPAQRFATAQELVEAYQQALLAPVVLAQSEETFLQGADLEEAGNAARAGKSLWPLIEALSQRPRARPMAVAMVMLAFLFVLGATTLAIEYQAHPALPTNANAQMISLPAHRPTVSPTVLVPTPTATAKPTAKPKPTSGGTNINDDGPDRPPKHPKHPKHHKGD